MKYRLQDMTELKPQPRQVRVTGVLDKIRHSTRSFGLKLEDGTEVRGVLNTREQTEELKQFLGKKLLVLGRAVYRVSGKLLRIDAEGFEAGEGQPRLFAKVPVAREIRPAIVPIKPASHQQQGVSAFFGTWPGEETDEDFEQMLAELRG
jgi:aspartyl/asparaginyl-tRNA synthetase